MKFEFELKRSVIEEEIKKHFKENYDPLSPQLDMEAKFFHKGAQFVYNFKIPYSTCNVNIYDDTEISCKCGVFSVDFKLIEDIKQRRKSIAVELLEIEEKIEEKL